MSLRICKICLEIMDERCTGGGAPYPVPPWAHCHHDDEKLLINGKYYYGSTKQKCWCEYPKDQRNNWNVSVRDEEGLPNPVWDIVLCPVCGQTLED